MNGDGQWLKAQKVQKQSSSARQNKAQVSEHTANPAK